MAPQSATPASGCVLEAANLITSVRRAGRAASTCLWSVRDAGSKFNGRACGAERHRATARRLWLTSRASSTSPTSEADQRVCGTLTDPDLTASTRRATSPTGRRIPDGSTGTSTARTSLMTAQCWSPCPRAAVTFDAPGDVPANRPSRLTFNMACWRIVRLTVTHENLATNSPCASPPDRRRLRQPQVAARDRPSCPIAIGDLRQAGTSQMAPTTPASGS